MHSKRFLVTVGATVALIATIGTSNAQSIGGSPLHASLNGYEECNATGTCQKGDLDAFGAATILFISGTRLCYSLIAFKLAGATAAHIHEGIPTVNGPVVITLTPPVAPSNANPGVSGDCISGVAGTLVSRIRKEPHKFYVNIHNGAFPSGAIRGQLH